MRLCPDSRAHELYADLDRLALFCLGVDDYISGRQIRKSLDVLAQERIFVQHSLLMKFDQTPSRIDGDIVTLCHLVAVAFSLLCIVPIPSAPFHRIVKDIRAQFTVNDFGREWLEAPQLMTWIVCVTAVVAVGMARERDWAIGVLERCLHRLRIQSWPELKELLLGFLWLPVTNDFDGMQLFAAIGKSNPIAGLGFRAERFGGNDT